MRTFIKATLFSMLITSQVFAAEEGGGVIKQATKQCEQAVTQQCINVSCPAYCEKINERRRNKDQLITTCKADCTAQKRCLLKPMGGQDDPQDPELDAQNRDQLFACIAEVRDPEGTKSGRRMEPWQTLKTPSWEKLFAK